MLAMSQAYWIAFAQCRSISLKEKHVLLKHFGTLKEVHEAFLKASESHSDNVGTVSKIQELLKKIGDWNLDAAKNEMRLLSEHNAWVLCLEDQDYPKYLKQTIDAPLVLYGKGIWPRKDSKHLSVVGTRKMSSYGKRMTKLLCEEFSKAGMVLVSGLASGIDTVAHQASLNQNQPTIAVLGHGLGHLYPKENIQLAENITKVGCLLTEYAFNQGPQKYHFPQRNRIVAGLSKGTFVCEGAQKSGAGITARLALEENRNIYALPCPIDSEVSYLPNTLIAQGAKLVQSSKDILEDYGFVFDYGFNKKTLIGTEQENKTPLEQKKEHLQDLSLKLTKLQYELICAISESESVAEHDIQNVVACGSLDLIKNLALLESKGLIKRQLDGKWSESD